MKRLLIASAFAASLVMGFSPTADAGVKVGIFFGVPHYDYQVGPDYRYRRGYGWYHHGGGYGHYGRLSCREAKRQVRASGFRNVSTIECNGRTYTFEATNRRGRDITVFVDSRSGRVWRG